MGKRKKLLGILLAASIAGGALTVSQVDSSRFRNATDFSVFSNNVELGRTVSRAQLRTALSNAAKDIGYDINFKEVYDKGYRLGSVKETSNYQLTKVDVSIGLIQGLNLTIFGDARASLTIKPSGFVSNEEIRQYLSKVSDYLSEH